VNSRTLLIGLDGGTFSILDPLMEGGVMPFLRRFMAEGTRAELRSVIPPLTPPGWTSIMTGRSPGNHGVVDFFTFESSNSRYVRFTNSSHISCETVWSLVSRYGLTATVLNFPLTAPPRPISGCVVPGWVQWRYLRQYSHPPGLYERLKGLPTFNARELAMDLAVEQKALDGCSPEEQEAWVAFHLRRERQWFEILGYLMQQEPHHLTGIVFDGVDKLQHLFWRLLAAPSPTERRLSWEEKIRRLCVDYFQELDGLIGEAVALAGDDANVFIVSDHGFGPSYEIFHLNAWLQQNGYLKWAEEPPRGQGAPDTLGLNLIGWMDRLIDWRKTTAYAHSPSSNGIHICVAGQRGTEGIALGEYHGFRQELLDKLRRFSDPDTGEPVVTEVWTREEAFPGTHTHLAPDLTLRLRDGGFISTLKSDVVLSARAELVGTHRPEGIFLARGPAVAKGALLPQISVLDITPTLLYALGLPVPEDLEGRVPRELFRASFVHSHPIVIGERTEPPKAFPLPAAETDEDEAVIARLKALGYLE
jgi:predicted AlkP superfamily phosphohydrolase/phosphomutase